jgi:hypothetical protein
MNFAHIGVRYIDHLPPNGDLIICPAECFADENLKNKIVMPSAFITVMDNCF